MDEYEKARAGFAKFLGANTDEVAILPSASAGINSIASALNFRERKKIVLGEFEFPTMGHVWLAQRERGAQVEFVEATGDRMPAENYEAGCRQKYVDCPCNRAVLHERLALGSEKACRACSLARRALVMLDDYQDCGTRPVNVKDLDVDIYVAGTLKYLLGPPGWP